MNTREYDAKLLEFACCGNAEAMDFLFSHWMAYAGAVDDIVDGDITDPEEIIAVFAKAAYMYSHPFYLKNLAELRGAVLTATSTFADSVAWEKSPEDWKRNWADHARHSGADVAIAIARICGGYEHSRKFAKEFRALCWFEHHDADGKPE